MSVVHWMGAPESKTALVIMLAGVFLLIAVAAMSARLASQLSDGTALLGATFLSVALYYPLVFWTLRGMEVALVACLLTSAVFLAIGLEQKYSRRHLFLIAVLLCAMVVTRRDAAVLHVVVSTYVVWASRSARPTAAAIALTTSLVVALGGQVLFSLWYYGDVLPNTYYLKLQGASFAVRLTRGAGSLMAVTARHLYPLLIPATIGIWFGWRDPTKRGRLVLLASLVCAQAGYMVYVGGDAWVWMGYANRYLSLVIPVLAVLAMFGLWHVAVRLRAHPTAFARLVHVLVLGCLLRVGAVFALTWLGRGVDQTTAALVAQQGGITAAISLAARGRRADS